MTNDNPDGAARWEVCGHCKRDRWRDEEIVCWCPHCGADVHQDCVCPERYDALNAAPEANPLAVVLLREVVTFVNQRLGVRGKDIDAWAELSERASAFLTPNPQGSDVLGVNYATIRPGQTVVGVDVNVTQQVYEAMLLVQSAHPTPRMSGAITALRPYVREAK